MNRRRLGIGCFLLICILTVGGCQLAKEDAGEISKRDCLVGVYITLEPIDCLEDEEAKKIFSKRGSKIEDGYEVPTFDFEGYEGISAIRTEAIHMGEDDGCSYYIGNEYMVDMNEKYLDNNYELEATIYYDASKKEVIYPNPVYQTEDEQIYMIPAESGIACSGLTSFWISDKWKNADSDGEQEEARTFTLHFKEMSNATTMYVKQYNAKDEIITFQQIEAGAVPKSIKKEKNMEYIIVTYEGMQSEEEENVSREMQNKDVNFTRFYTMQENGFAKHQIIELLE